MYLYGATLALGLCAGLTYSIVKIELLALLLVSFLTFSYFADFMYEDAYSLLLCVFMFNSGLVIHAMAEYIGTAVRSKDFETE